MIDTQGVQHYPIDPATGLLPYGDKIIVPNGGGYMAADWPDSNLDGLADGWAGIYESDSSAYTIVTGNGFSGNAQRYEATETLSLYSLISTTGQFNPNHTYKVSFMLRFSFSNTPNFLVQKAGNQVIHTVVGNITGNAQLIEFTTKIDNVHSTPREIAFREPGAYLNIGDWFEIDEINIEELPCELSLPLANSLTDFSPNSHAVTAPNGYSSASDKFEQAGQAISLNGTNQYLNHPTNIINGSVLTVSAWVKPVSLGTLMNIFGRYDLITDPNNINYVGVLTDGTVRLFSGSQTNQINFTSNSIISTGEWYHIVAYMDILNEEFKVYVNGQIVGGNIAKVGTPATTFNTSTVTFKTGLIRTGTGFIYASNTILSHIFVINRELTHAEIDRLWRQQP